MNNQNENLKELLKQFLNSEKAEHTFEDLQKGQELLYKYPAPEPQDELIADIKGKVSRILMQRKSHSSRRKIFYEMAAVAAAIVIITTASLKLSEKDSNIADKKNPYTATLASAIWESENLAEDDPELATLKAEIEQIAKEVSAAQLDDIYGNGYGDLTDLETELIEISSEFWKG